MADILALASVVAGGATASAGAATRPPPAPQSARRVASAALSGGLAAAASQVLTVPLFMWMQTVTCYQHKHGGDVIQVARALYAEGGIGRFYRGLLPTLVHTPLCRFGGIAATDGAFEALAHLRLPTAATAMVASAGAAGCRALLMPLGALSTVQQVNGLEGRRMLLEQVSRRPLTLWRGAGSAATATWLGQWIWCTADRQLRAVTPQFEMSYGKHVRNILIGFVSSIISDALTNPFRVLCTMRQTSAEQLTYGACARRVLDQEGFAGFMQRGLMSRVLMNGMQGALLTLGWKAIAEKIAS